MASFSIAVDKLIETEGGYANSKYDRGGETKYGISKKSYPNLDIKNLTISDAKRIYFVDFWEPIKGDQIKNQELANYYLDMAANHGVNRATKIIQKSAGVPIDGIIGPITLSKINTNPIDTLKNAVINRIAFFNAIVKNDPTQEKNLNSWLARAKNVEIIAVKTASVLLPIAIGFLLYYLASNLTKG